MAHAQTDQDPCGGQNKFITAREPTVLDDSEVQVPVNNDFYEAFERDKFDGKKLAKVSLIIL